MVSFDDKKKVERINDYIDLIYDINTTYSTTTTKQCVFLYRGQGKEYDLLPSIARNYPDNVLDLERQILNEFKIKSIPYLMQKDDNDWDTLSFAQHHGLPTRLLDWTENPLVALFFAVENGHSSDDGVIWIYDLERYDVISEKSNPFTLSETMFHQPKYISNRIISQKGWFSIHHYSKESNRFIPINQNDKYRNYLQKISISGKAKSDIKMHLDKMGINESSLFPDLQGLTKYLKWKHSIKESEIKK